MHQGVEVVYERFEGVETLTKWLNCTTVHIIIWGAALEYINSSLPNYRKHIYFPSAIISRGLYIF
jgi:hypothetical protein